MHFFKVPSGHRHLVLYSFAKLPFFTKMPYDKFTKKYYDTATDIQRWNRSQPNEAWKKSKLKKNIGPFISKSFSKPSYRETQPRYTPAQTRFGRKIKGGWNVQLLPNKPHHASHVVTYYKRQQQRIRANKNKAIALRKRKYVNLT